MAVLLGNRGLGCPIIELTASYWKDGQPWDKPEPCPNEPIKALIDTGATDVLIDLDLAKKLKLIEGRTRPHTVIGHDPAEVPTFSCRITVLTNHGPREINIHEALGEKLKGYQMLIGWTVLEKTEMHFNRDGSFSIDWGW